MLADKMAHELFARETYPKKVIIGIDAYNQVMQEITTAPSLFVGLSNDIVNKHVRLFGMEIELDDADKMRIEYVD